MRLDTLGFQFIPINKIAPSPKILYFSRKRHAMKNILLIVVLIISIEANSQTAFSWLTNDTIETTIASNSYTELKLEQVNETGADLNLSVEVVYKDVPAGWDGMICIEGLCLGTVPAVGTTADMVTISGSTNGWVRWTVNPLGDLGPAKVRIRVFDKDNPSDGDTATWIVTSEPLGLEDLTESGDFTLYPNPASEWMNIENNDKIDVLEFYSIQGQLMKSITLNKDTKQTIYINDLPSGLYFVNAISDGILEGTRKVSIQ